MLLEAAVRTNLPEYTVSEIGSAVKRVVEDHFGFVRVRGEVSGAKRASSGHWYFSLKDSQAVLEAVCWKMTAERLSIPPEDGLEVICAGRITTYPGRSKYQLVVEEIQLAGEGALMALLERRKQMLAAEGLFDERRKRPLPYLPERIGVITSPTGAVIRDILHRLQDRCPVTVTVWPVLVQGEGAAEQVAEAIRGFNRLPEETRPDLLIVARGGGSLEDLWAFNEEAPVRAAAASGIPLISAVGHETDVTLMDFVADRRAPTPSAAAEMAVPVRSELLVAVRALQLRMVQQIQQAMKHEMQRLETLKRSLPKVTHLFGPYVQRLDGAAMELTRHVQFRLHEAEQRLIKGGSRLQRPDIVLVRGEQRLQRYRDLLENAMIQRFEKALWRLQSGEQGLRPERLQLRFQPLARQLERESLRLRRAAVNYMQAQTQSLTYLGGLLHSYDYRQVLKRGYALVRDGEGQLIRRAASVPESGRLHIEWKDGIRAVGIEALLATASSPDMPEIPEAPSAPDPAPVGKDKSIRQKKSPAPPMPEQKGLFD